MAHTNLPINILRTRPAEKCGIFGVYGQGMEAARLVHSGLWALQHRGQESSGIASTEGGVIRLHKDQGLVAHVYDEEDLILLSGFAAIGHNRYATSGGGDKRHAQPIVGPAKTIALAHNGNLPSTKKIEQFLNQHQIDHDGMNDSAMMQAVIEFYFSNGKSLKRAVELSLSLFTGVYCLLLLTKDCIAAIRDPHGIRPLSIVN